MTKITYHLLGLVERPVVEDLRIAVRGVELLAIHKEGHVVDVREDDRVRVPFVVAHLRSVPAPLGGAEFRCRVLGLATQKKLELAVPQVHSEVVAVHA